MIFKKLVKPAIQAALSLLRHNALLYGVVVLFQVLPMVYWMVAWVTLGGVVSYMDQKSSTVLK